MHIPITTCFPLALSFFTTAAATTSQLQRRGLPGAVYICTDQNFGGDCAWQMPSTDCHIPGTGQFAPESIGPDPGGFCILYSSATCTGTQIEEIRFPGISTGLPAFGGLMCSKDAAGQSNTEVNTITGGTRKEDATLAGGVGSTTLKDVEVQMEAMQKDGFKEGFIGGKKGVYY